MIDLFKVINEDTFIISDTHFGHSRVLQFEPVRVEYLADYNTDVTGKCHELLNLLETIPKDEHRQNTDIGNLCKDLIIFHDQMLVEKWNSVVGEKDTVLHGGDFAFRGIEEHTQNLNGRKILLRGNHDLKSGRHYVECGWKEVIETVKMNISEKMFEMVPSPDKYWNGLLTSINGWKILFSHYPIYNNNEWDVKKYGHITDMLQDVYEGFGGEINIHGHVHSNNSIFSNAINVSTERCTSLTPIKLSELLENNGYGKK